MTGRMHPASPGHLPTPTDVPDLYICPTSGETESRTLGGFDVCCNHPRCPGNLYSTRASVIPPGDDQ